MTAPSQEFDELPGISKALCKAIDFAEWGWTIIANASGGDWEKESKDWQDAAAKYRDQFHSEIRFLSGVPLSEKANPLITRSELGDLMRGFDDNLERVRRSFEEVVRALQDPNLYRQAMMDSAAKYVRLRKAIVENEPATVDQLVERVEQWRRTAASQRQALIAIQKDCFAFRHVNGGLPFSRISRLIDDVLYPNDGKPLSEAEEEQRE